MVCHILVLGLGLVLHMQDQMLRRDIMSVNLQLQKIQLWCLVIVVRSKTYNIEDIFEF